MNFNPDVMPSKKDLSDEELDERINEAIEFLKSSKEGGDQVFHKSLEAINKDRVDNRISSKKADMDIDDLIFTTQQDEIDMNNNYYVKEGILGLERGDSADEEDLVSSNDKKRIFKKLLGRPDGLALLNELPLSKEFMGSMDKEDIEKFNLLNKKVNEG